MKAANILPLCVLMTLFVIPPIHANEDVVSAEAFLAEVTSSPFHKLHLTHYHDDQNSFGTVGLWPSLKLSDDANIIGSGFDDDITNLPRGSRSAGGAGNDKVIVGLLGIGLGQDDDDSLAGVGVQSSLSGGSGRDVFDLENTRLIMDLEPGDLLTIDGRRILGGVPWEIDDPILIP